MATGTSTGTGTGRTGTSRPVLFTGLALGTAITVLAVWDGLRLNVPGVPSILRAVLGVLILWALFAAAGALLSELSVRHHRAALRHGWRRGKRGGAYLIRRGGAAWRVSAARSYPWRARFLDVLRDRWAARGGQDDGGELYGAAGLGMAIALSGRDEDGSPEPAARPEVCAACGNPEGGTLGPLVTFRGDLGDGARSRLIHQAHFEDRATGFYGQPYDHGWPGDGTPPSRRVKQVGIGCLDHGPACRWVLYQDNHTEHTPSTEGNTMTETPAPAAPAAAPHAGHRVLTIGGTVPAEWKNLVTITADFEPEDDADLITWMAAEVNGMSAYAEALTEVYETGVSSLGLDPVSLAALHDTADAAADAAQAMAYARQKFAAHYAEVREFAASGGLLPHDGRWITGDGE